MTAEKETDQAVVDEMFTFGARALASAAKVFLEEAKRKGMEPPDAILLFASLLITRAAAVLRAMLPGEGTLQIMLDMVKEEWHTIDKETSEDPKAN